MPTERRLAAIMFTDIVGSTAVTARSESAGLALRDRHRELVRGQVERYHGRFIEAPGDESLSTFGSAVDAVHAALTVQQQLDGDAELQVRIGIHLGETMFRGDEVFGDGVNIAARIRPIAEPGGICISDEVQHAIRNQENIETVALGEHELKNVGRPVAVFRVGGEAGVPSFVPASFTVPGFGGRPAVAVLPFDSLSGDSEQEYFADGIAQDLATRLSAWRWFPVISCDSTFAYKGVAADLRRIGQELGAQYLVGGSVRQAGDRIRINARLAEAESGHILWTEQFDRQFKDVFALQDEIAETIVARIEPEIQVSEVERSSREHPADLNADELIDGLRKAGFAES